MTDKVKAKDIEALVRLFVASGWDEMSVETEGLSLFLSTDPAASRGAGVTPVASAPAAAPLAAAPVPAAPVVSAAAPAAAAGDDGVGANWVAVRAPNLGTFYRAPKPGAAPFIELGQVVTTETEICLIEVMKLFTTLKAGVAGTVRRVCAKDGELVEGDQILFYIEPA